MSLYFEIISRQRVSPVAVAARAGLRVLSWPYGVAIRARNWYFDWLTDPRWMSCPCVSVGNLTTGGTGKTPVVMWLAQRQVAAGRKVAVVSRGYKGDASGCDELQLLSAHCPQAICVAHARRVLACEYVIAEHHVDLILLDDAFQHRRLGRDLDIVLIDATRPFGYGHLLPRGLLREPVTRLQAADVVIVTRLNQVTPAQLAALKSQLTELAPEARVLGCSHRPTALLDLDGQCHELATAAAKAVATFCGVGNPQAFTRTVEQVGFKPIRSFDFPDHHAYSITDCTEVAQQAARAGAELLVTTEKDMVKLRRLNFDWPVPVFALQIAIDFAGDGGKMLLDEVNALFDGEDPVDAEAL